MCDYTQFYGYESSIRTCDLRRCHNLDTNFSWFSLVSSYKSPYSTLTLKGRTKAVSPAFWKVTRSFPQRLWWTDQPYSPHTNRSSYSHLSVIHKRQSLESCVPSGVAVLLTQLMFSHFLQYYITFAAHTASLNNKRSKRDKIMLTATRSLFPAGNRMMVSFCHFILWNALSVLTYSVPSGEWPQIWVYVHKILNPLAYIDVYGASVRTGNFN
jgi:hypothetical protein